MLMNSLEFHVAPDGNDNWSGRYATPAAGGQDGPWATVGGARDALRQLRGQPDGKGRPVTVRIHAGVYALPETLCFDSRDGGSAEAPVRYVANEGAAPVISGGRHITQWTESAHQGQRCWTADLPEVIKDHWNFTRLYVNDTPRSRPRLPKQGFYHFTGLAGFEDSGFKWRQGPDRANFAAGEIRQWHNWQDVELISYQLWFDTHHRFKAIDEEAGVVQFQARSLGSLRDERGDFARYFVENVFEALDTPGEWYLDRVAGKLYYLPLPGEALENTVIVAPRLETLVRLEGAPGLLLENLQFENLQFAHQHWQLPPDCSGYIQAAFGVPGAIVLERAAHCVFYGCTIAHLNGYGIEILAGSTENILAACVVHDAGAGGVKIGHEELAVHESAVGEPLAGDPPPMATTVVDCTIRDCGHVFPSAIGIWVGNSGWNRLLHNRIFHCTYTGISCGWIWGYAPSRTVANRIEYNHIHHINDKAILSDNGGIYTLGRQPGTTLRGNVIHDISCYGYGGWGIYPDEGSSEMRVEQNLVCGTLKAAYQIHYGRDNLVQQNIFALSQADHLGLGKRERHRSAVFRNNVLLTANGSVSGGARQLDPAHYTLTSNLYWSLDGSSFTFNGIPLAAMQAAGQHSATLVADPLFADAAGLDFALRPDSPARLIGFEPFDTRMAGTRFHSERPGSYAAYSEQFTLPSGEIPVVQTCIEPKAGESALRKGQVGFTVTLRNLGRAQGKGSIRLASGPEGKATAPTMDGLDYDLAPGAEQEVAVYVAVERDAEVVWLESDAEDTLTVPSRALIFSDTFGVLAVTSASMPATAAEIPDLVQQHPVRSVRQGERQVAELRFASCAEALLVHVHFLETELRPNLQMPWVGTGIELIAFQPREPGVSVLQPCPKRQICLVPEAEGDRLHALYVGDAGSTPVPEPSIQTWMEASAAGYHLAAIVPWGLLGFSTAPAEVPFDVVVDTVDGATGRVVQTTLFDLPSDGWHQLQGRLVMS